ncbi:MAG: response regulator [Oscillospiraceae bacterium]|nr:response regulator [Oscillospiraceae bacterium]
MEKKIMIVDDAAFMRMMIKNSLTTNGYNNLIEAGDGLQALESYQTEKPDLVIMDITMPNMDGIQALQAIKAFDKDAKIVMCSAMGQESMVVDAIRFGALDFIVKPFKPDRILQTVQKVLG